MKKTAPVPPQTKNGFRLWLLAVAAFFLARILPWALAELWYDEVLSLQMFVLGHDSPLAIFRDYRIANNHFLANALEWLWIKFLPYATGNEFLLRIPAILCGIGTLLTATLGWRKWLGEKFALATGFLLAASPVFPAFAFQMRGYSLAMLLATLAVTAAMYRLEKCTPRNGLALFACSLGLSFVMPSAAMLPAALMAAIGLHWLSDRKNSILFPLRQLAPAFCGALLGTAYYLTLWADFQKARAESGGWESTWLTGVHLLLAFGLHLAVFAIPLARSVFSRKQESNLPRAFFCGAVLAALAVLLVPSPVHRAPFPRVFLVLLPLVTFAAALAAKSWHFTEEPFAKGSDHLPFKKLAFAAILPGLLVGILCEKLTGYQLEHSTRIPQNLLMQYYRGNSPNREFCLSLATQEQRPLQIIAVEPLDLPTFSLYWQLAGLPPTLPGNLPAFLPGNQPLPSQARSASLKLFARNEACAKELCHSMKLPDAPLSGLPATSHRTLFSFPLWQAPPIDPVRP